MFLLKSIFWSSSRLPSTSSLTLVMSDITLAMARVCVSVSAARLASCLPTSIVLASDADAVSLACLPY